MVARLCQGDHVSDHLIYHCRNQISDGIPWFSCCLTEVEESPVRMPQDKCKRDPLQSPPPLPSLSDQKSLKKDTNMCFEQA